MENFVSCLLLEHSSCDSCPSYQSKYPTSVFGTLLLTFILQTRFTLRTYLLPEVTGRLCHTANVRPAQLRLVTETVCDEKWAASPCVQLLRLLPYWVALLMMQGTRRRLIRQCAANLSDKMASAVLLDSLYTRRRENRQGEHTQRRWNYGSCAGLHYGPPTIGLRTSIFTRSRVGVLLSALNYRSAVKGTRC